MMSISMQQIETQQALRQALDAHMALGRSIGLVPTMGALHAGHASLIRRAVHENDIVVVSDFVNPTQFNNPQDLASYPRDLVRDSQLVQALGGHILFVPSVEEIYPEPDTREFDFSPLDKVMEGARRPGHFNGVAQVVSKLFELVRPHTAYFGEKDYQQLQIIRRLVEDLKMPIRIIGCPTVREADGLAMSSRNQLLDSACRKAAPIIHATLEEATAIIGKKSNAEVIEWVTEQINQTRVLHVEYFILADVNTLQPVEHFTPGKVMGFIAVQAGATRLIDNQRY